MKKSLFAATLAATLLTLGAPQLAQAQYYDSTGTAWNNGTSAIFGSMTAGNSMALYNRQQIIRSLRRGENGGGALTTKQRGTLIIDSGKASLTFAARPFPIGQYMKTTWSGNGNKAVKRRYYAEWLAQDAIWKAEVKARGAATNNVADVVALSEVMAFEAVTGRRVNAQGYNLVREDHKQFFLTQAAAFQGYSTREKQEFCEGVLVRTTDALRLRRAGHRAEAEKDGRAFLDSWATGKAEGALELLTPLSSPARQSNGQRVARTSAPVRLKPRPVSSPPASTQAPQMTLAQANAIVRYKPVASSVLPDLLVKANNTPKAKRAAEFETYEKMLDAGHANMRKLFTAAPNNQDDVSDAMTFAVLMMVATVKSDSGDIGKAGFTPQNAQALNERLTLMLAGNPAFKQQSARQKQQMAETAILLAVMVRVMDEQAAKNGDAALKTKARAFAHQSMQRMLGVSLDKVEVTPTDIVFNP